MAPLGEKFGNVAAITLMKNGDLLVYNRNPDIMMVEYDPSGTTVKRVFNPNMAMNPHGLRIDRYGNIWAIDTFLNVIYKMNSKGEVLKVFGVRGENAPWDDSKWNGMFNQPLDIAFDKDDNFYVVQSHGGTSPPADCTFCATYDSPQTHNAKGRAVFVTHPPAIPGSDPRVMKFDKDGNLLASRQPRPSRRQAAHHPYRDRGAQWRSLGRRPRLAEDPDLRQGSQEPSRHPDAEPDLRLL